MRTQTLFISFEKLKEKRGYDTVATLALVYNDLIIANSAMSTYQSSHSEKSMQHIKYGAGIYFSRMMAGHLSEGLSTIQKIRETVFLRRLVDDCPELTQVAFEELCECLPSGKEAKKFKEYVVFVRNRVAFHYDPKDVKWAIEDRSTRAKANTSTLTAGTDIHSHRFEFADRILDSIICRRLWKIPQGPNMSKEADRIIIWCNKKTRRFLEFAGGYVPEYLKKNNVTI